MTRRSLRQRLVGPALAVLSGLLSVACVELILTFGGEKRVVRGSYHELGEAGGGTRQRSRPFDERLGYRLPPDAKLTSALWIDGELAYDVLYTTDSKRRRTHPHTSSTAPREHALFFGGSYVFGTGVQDDETLPARFESASDAVRAYNYGVAGYGPTQMLEHLRRSDFADEIPERRGKAYYLYIDHHVSRVIGGLYTYTKWARDFPYYTLEGGELSRRGSFTSGRPFRSLVYRALGRLQLVGRFRIDWPYPHDDPDFEITASVITASRDAYRDRFGTDAFHVIIYPWSRSRGQIVPRLEAEGVRVLDYGDLFDALGSKRDFRLLDLHPSPSAHRVLAERLVGEMG